MHERAHVSHVWTDEERAAWAVRMRQGALAWSKLDEVKLVEIRSRLALGHRNADIARDMGVHRSVISKVKHGKRWGYQEKDSNLRHPAYGADVLPTELS